MSSKNLSFLAGCGSTLTALLRSAKSREPHGSTAVTESGISSEDIHEEVKRAINQLLEALNGVRGLLIEESAATVMAKIEGTLNEFIKFDAHNEDSYKQLADKVKSFKLDAKQHYSNSGVDSDTDSDSDSEPAYENLGEVEKRCLLWFSMFGEGMEIKKRDVLYGWIGMGLISPALDGGEKALKDVLGKLVGKGFIERVIRNRKERNAYKMRARVLAKVTNESWSHRVAQHGHFRLMLRSTSNSTSDHKVRDREIEALYNSGVQSLNIKRCNWLSQLYNVKAMHLGSWKRKRKQQDQDAEPNIMIEDIESLKAFRHLKSVRYLSFQGLSGITELPASICKLGNLRVLDLRGCNNLELLPQEIGSLEQLTHLDLSECYLLDHVPKGVASLSRLKVLKGFVINPDLFYSPQPAGAAGNGNKFRKTRRISFSLSCAFKDLSELKQLMKLTVRTRRMDFPTTQDLQTLCKMQQLNNLRISWVGSFDDAQAESSWEVSELERQFPDNLQKLELQAMPEITASRLLGLIRETDNCIEKLHIRGGELQDLSPNEHSSIFIKVLCLRYLPKLHMDWPEFTRAFPNVTRLEIFKCPNLIFFPCDDKGKWELDE